MSGTALPRAGLALCAFVAIACAVSGLRAQPRPTFAGNLLIVTVDALRADRLGAAGHRSAQGSLTPNLDGLARRGAYFKRVWAQAPSSARSLGALLTGRYASHLAWGRSGAGPRLLAANTTLFEALQSAGYRTIGSSDAPALQRDPGLRQGLHEWLGTPSTNAAANANGSESSTARAVARLKRAASARERFALWLHLSEPVATTGAPEAAIGASDRGIGQLLTAVGELGLTASTAVVVVGVHGSVNSPHTRAQRHALYEEQLRVPLIVAVPGVAPMNVDVPTAGIDLAPTVLDLIGAARLDSFEGQSLLAHVRNLGAPDDKVRPVYAELLPEGAAAARATMLVVDGFKLIRTRGARFELYSLREDRGETNNLVADPNHKIALEALRRRLKSFERR